MSDFKPTFKETVKRPLGELKWDPNVDASDITIEDVTEQEAGQSFQFIGGVGPGEGGDKPKDGAPADGGDAGEVAKFADQPVGKDAEFESSHPRDEIGRFAHGAGEGSGPGGKPRPLKEQFGRAVDEFHNAVWKLGRNEDGSNKDMVHSSSAYNDLYYAHPNASQLKSFARRYDAAVKAHPELKQLQPLFDKVNDLGAQVNAEKNAPPKPKELRSIEDIRADLSRVRQSHFMTMGQQTMERGLVRELNAALRAQKEQQDAAKPVGSRPQDISEKVDAAIAPVRAKLREAFDQKLHDQYNAISARLQANDMDLTKAFPYPDSSKLSRAQYATALRGREAAQRWFTADPARPTYRKDRTDPEYVKPIRSDEERKAYIARRAEELADESYKDYVGKLTGKISEASGGKPVTGVTHRAGHDLWDWSMLEVHLEGGETVRLQTQQIINVSVLGTPYNQWPTRVVGAKKTQ